MARAYFSKLVAAVWKWSSNYHEIGRMMGPVTVRFMCLHSLHVSEMLCIFLYNL